MSLSASGPSVNTGYESSSSSSEESYAGQVLLGDLSEAGTSYGTLPFTGARGQAQGNQLGWIMGVFVPTMLGILGVVTFLRMGWVVGETGLLLSWTIVILGNCCTILTWSSLSAIATNGRMKGGGAYYMISRSLGPEFGGSIGLIFYLANVFGAGVYIKGFVEATQTAISSYSFYQNISEYDYWLGVMLGTWVLILMTATCCVGASFFIKFLGFIYVVEVFSLLFALFSFAFQSENVIPGYTGWSWDTLQDNLGPHYSPADGVAQNFQTVFAVFFPAMAGIMGGANMSGDLREPGYAIPKGTICAILFAFVLYMIQMFVMAATTTSQALTSYSIFQEVSFWSPIITIGVYCAALSSTVSGMSGGSRILQALARDKIVPFINIFSRGVGKEDEPIYATLLTYVLVQILMFLPNLNTLATISSLFFLFSYSLTNLACFALQVAGAPNFRPSFKYFRWYTSLLGAILCFVSCFIVSVLMATVALFCISALFLYIYFSGPEREWGDVKQAIIFHQVRKFLLRLDVRKTHLKNWRPSLLLMVNHPETQKPQICFANQLKKGGLLIIGTVYTGECTADNLSAVERLKSSYVEFISQTGIKAFDEVIVAPTVLTGMHSLISTAGVGLMKPNTIVFGFPRSFQLDSEQEPFHEFDHTVEFVVHRDPYDLSSQEYVACINRALLFQKHVLITRGLKRFNEASLAGGKISRWSRKLAGGKRKRIDCWAVLPLDDHTRAANPSMTMAIMFGWILSRSKFWRDHTNLRIVTISTAAHRDQTEKMISGLMEYCRIEGRVLVLDLNEEKNDIPQATTPEATRRPFLLDLSLEERYAVFNQLMQKHGRQAATTFFPIIPPPEEPTPEQSHEYIHALDILTRELSSPIVLVRGSGDVMTSEL